MPPAVTTPPPTPPTARWPPPSPGTGRSPGTLRRTGSWPPALRSRTPVLYLRGDEERGGDITGYAEGLRRAGVTNLDYATVPGCGHFPHEEAPGLLWDRIATFAGLTG